MKIVLCGTAYPLRGAMAQLNAILASHLSARSSVEIVSFSRQYPSLLFPGKTQIDPSKPLFDLKITPMVDSINPFTWFSAGNYIASLKADLLVIRYWMPFFGPSFGTIARRAKKGTGTKVVYICDNVIPHEKRPGDIALTKYALSCADHCIVHSNAVGRDLASLLPQMPQTMIPHPLYEVFGGPLPKEKAKQQAGLSAKKVILFFGYVRAYKGLPVLLNALTLLPDVHLCIVGEFYEDESKYRQMVTDLKLNDRVTIVSDYVANDRVPVYFCAADAVILPYLSATQSGIAQVAYNFDKPVIATNVGGLAEVVRDNITGFIVPANDRDALAGAIRKFYDSNLEPQFSANVATEKRKYSWDNLVSTIEQLAGKGGGERRA
jgi:glycosyltransferase involved in cell wall biosynthesis